MTPKEQAQSELNKMRGTLARWLTVRQAVDEAAVGKRTAKYSAPVIAQIIQAYRNPFNEERLGSQLRAFLSEVYDSPGVDINSMSTVDLAKIVISGKLPNETPSAQGILPILWVGIIAAGAWVIVSSVTTFAQKAKEDEERAACAAGVTEYCPTNWAMYGLVAVLGWALITKTKVFGK